MVVDHLVVGAGSAGCVIAARLAATGATVALLEAGGARPPAGVNGVDFMAAVAEPGWIWPDLVAVRTSQQGARRYLRGRGLGGSSAVNALVAIDGLPEDYDRWGLPGWTWEALAEARAASRVRTELSAPGAVGHALMDACRSLGIAGVADSCAEIGVGPIRLTMDHGRRVSAADAYLSGPEVVDVRPDALVDRVLIERGRAVGVRLVDGREIEAHHVVLAAGALHTPAILLRSGIDRPGVGANLQDHVALAASLMLRAEHRAPEGVPAATALARWSSGASAADLQLVAFDHLGPGDGRNVGMVMLGLMDVRSQGRVTLASDDPTVDPLVELRLLSDADGHDEAALLRGLDGLLQVVTGDALSAVADAVYLDDRGTTPDLLDLGRAGEFCRANLADYVHPVGTCAMGRADDPMAVVDSDGHVIGLEGLSVADASVIPRLPRANTHVPVTVVAEELARRWTRWGSAVMGR